MGVVRVVPLAWLLGACYDPNAGPPPAVDATGPGADGATDAPPVDDASGAVGCGVQTQGPYVTDFTSQPSWLEFYDQANSAVSVSGGELVFSLAAGTSYSEAYVPTGGSYLGRRIFLRLLEPLETGNDNSIKFRLVASDDSTVTIGLDGLGVLWMDIDGTEVANLAFEPALHRWWQIQIDGGLVYTLSTSPDGLDWATRATGTAPSGMSEASLYLIVDAYQALGSADLVRFDDLWDCTL